MKKWLIDNWKEIIISFALACLIIFGICLSFYIIKLIYSVFVFILAVCMACMN